MVTLNYTKDDFFIDSVTYYRQLIALDFILFVIHKVGWIEMSPLPKGLSVL